MLLKTSKSGSREGGNADCVKKSQRKERRSWIESGEPGQEAEAISKTSGGEGGEYQRGKRKKQKASQTQSTSQPGGSTPREAKGNQEKRKTQGARGGAKGESAEASVVGKKGGSKGQKNEGRRDEDEKTGIEAQRPDQGGRPTKWGKKNMRTDGEGDFPEMEQR